MCGVGGSRSAVQSGLREAPQHAWRALLGGGLRPRMGPGEEGRRQLCIGGSLEEWDREMCAAASLEGGGQVLGGVLWRRGDERPWE